MSAALPLLAAGVGKLSRSASGIATRVSRAFHILRIDGYSWSKTIPGGESIRSSFTVGDLTGWDLHYYPNGTDASNHYSDSISVYLRFNGGHEHDEFPRRVVAQYKFSVLDSATGAAAYELPAETGVYYTSGDGGEEEDYYHYLYGNVYYYDEEEKMEEHLIPPPVELGCGYDGFIAKAELERRREMLLKDDSLAIRCDVDVVDTEYIRR